MRHWYYIYIARYIESTMEYAVQVENEYFSGSLVMRLR